MYQQHQPSQPDRGYGYQSYVPPRRVGSRPSVWIGLLVIAALGLVLNQQSVSLASGSSVVWVGFAITVIASVVSFVVPGVPWIVRVALLAVAVLALGSAAYVEHELAQRRHELNQLISRLDAP